MLTQPGHVTFGTAVRQQVTLLDSDSPEAAWSRRSGPGSSPPECDCSEHAVCADHARRSPDGSKILHRVACLPRDRRHRARPSSPRRRRPPLRGRHRRLPEGHNGAAAVTARGSVRMIRRHDRAAEPLRGTLERPQEHLRDVMSPASVPSARLVLKRNRKGRPHASPWWQTLQSQRVPARTGTLPRYRRGRADEISLGDLTTSASSTTTFGSLPPTQT